MNNYYDVDGTPITMETWSDLMERKYTEDYGRVALTEIGDVRVSTVWLGLDHSYWGGPPLIFETMVFDGPLHGQQWRYSSQPAALAGHDQVVAEVRDSLARHRGWPS